MYLERAIEEDRKMVESWKGDAEGILLFVSLHAASHTSAYNVDIIDWSLLCRGRSIARSVCPGYSAELAGHLSLLSRTYLPAIGYPAEWVTTSHHLELVQPRRAILPAYVERLGQWALVFESRHQFDLRPIGDDVTAMGASL
jgi:hypothetical protein